MEIKDLIREKRIEKGYTMQELAKKCKVSVGTISRWESGNIANMRRTTIASLSEVLDIPIERLMGFSEQVLEHRTRRAESADSYWNTLSVEEKAKATEILKAVFGGNEWVIKKYTKT